MIYFEIMAYFVCRLGWFGEDRHSVGPEKHDEKYVEKKQVNDLFGQLVDVNLVNLNFKRINKLIDSVVVRVDVDE